MPERGMMNGAEAILELLRTQSTDCIFASPIAVMAPLWEALAQRRARGADERPRYLQCRHESLAVSLASRYYNPVHAAFGFAQEHGVPILIVVCDNRQYFSQTWNVHKYFPEGAAVRTGQFIGNVISPTPEYAKLAEAYGGAGERVTKPAELDSAIQRALGTLAAGRSALLDVFVEP
jgi:thiamine pyrophosphate-dependent acetolactate synthase large subunit-like protein